MAALSVHAAAQGLQNFFRGRFLVVVQIPAQPQFSIDDDSGEESLETTLTSVAKASVTFTVTSENQKVSFQLLVTQCHLLLK